MRVKALAFLAAAGVGALQVAVPRPKLSKSLSSQSMEVSPNAAAGAASTRTPPHT